MKRIFAVAAVALFLACDNAPRHVLTLTFNDAGDRITIDAVTMLPMRKEARDKSRVEHLREELLAGRDEWALRFANAAPERDRATFDRTAGELTSVQRSATIDADDLQKFFYDLPITAKVIRGDGWVELAIYPGTSNRATRQDREDFDRRLEAGGRAARHYINGVRALYGYLDEHPRRAEDVFDALFRDDDDPRPIVATKVEMDLVKQVREGIDRILEIDWGGETSREADVLSNPFPATVVVRVPTEPILVENFTREPRGLVIQPKSLLEAVGALEGRWISPDPLALALRQPSGTKTEDLVAQLATAERHAQPVVGLGEVIDGLAAQLKPAPQYRVRFLFKAAAP